MTGDGLAAPLNAPPAGAVRPGVQPGASSPVVTAVRVLIYGTGGQFTGLFIYSPSPGAGNLIASAAAQAGTDPWGNSYQAGYASYGTSSYAQLFQSQLIWTVAGTGIVELYASDTGGLVLAGSAGTAYLAVAVPLSQPLVASEPGAASYGTAETWHTLSMSGGWTGTLQARLLPDGMVAVRSQGSLAAGTLANGTVIASLPSAAYYPTTTQPGIPVMISAVGAGSAASADSPYLLPTAAGTLEIFNVATQVATNIRVSGSFALD